MAPATAKNQFQAPKERFASEKSAKLMLFCRFLFPQLVTCLVLVAVEIFGIHEDPWDIFLVPNYKGFIAHHKVLVYLFYFLATHPKLCLFEVGEVILLVPLIHIHISSTPVVGWTILGKPMVDWRQMCDLGLGSGMDPAILTWGPCLCSDSFDLWTFLCRSPMGEMAPLKTLPTSSSAGSSWF